jgi:hypothetical protein
MTVKTFEDSLRLTRALQGFGVTDHHYTHIIQMFGTTPMKESHPRK